MGTSTKNFNNIEKKSQKTMLPFCCFQLSYDFCSVSDSSKKDLPAPRGLLGLQGIFTPLPIDALNVVGQKMEQYGFHCQNNGKFKFDYQSSDPISDTYMTSWTIIHFFLLMICPCQSQ